MSLVVVFAGVTMGPVAVADGQSVIGQRGQSADQSANNRHDCVFVGWADPQSTHVPVPDVCVSVVRMRTI